jgi:hypothetical protein
MSTYTYFDNTGFNKKKYENEISKNRDDLDKKLSNLYKNKDVIKQTQQNQKRLKTKKKVGGKIRVSILFTL